MHKLSTRRQIITLSAANIVSAALQFLLPVILVRLIDQESFGLYKLFWLAVNSIMLFAPLGMPRSLQYFLPRSVREDQHLFVNHTLVFLLFGGLIGAMLVSPFNPFLPDSVKQMIGGQFMLPAFMVLWVVATLIEFLPAADQRVGLQAIIVIGLAIVRFSVVVSVALITSDIHTIYAALVLFAAVKCLLLAYYYFRLYSHERIFNTSMRIFRKQLVYALTFGLAGIFNRLRVIAEQWIVAALFVPAAFGVFSIAVAVMPLLNMLKQSVGFVTVPKMSKLQSEGNLIKVLDLNNNGNIAVSFVMFPVIVFLFVFAKEFVTALYTSNFTEAATVLRVYALAALVMSIEMANVLFVLGQGGYVMRTSGFVVVITVVASYLGAQNFGLPGGALGSVLAAGIASLLYFRRVSNLLSVPFKSIQRWSTLLKLFISAVSAFIVIHYVLGLFGMLHYQFAGLVLGCLTGSILYLVLLVLFGEQKLLLASIGKGEWGNR